MSEENPDVDLVSRAVDLYKQLSEPQQLWLSEAVEAHRDSERGVSANTVSLKAKLDGQIPTDFDPSSISDKLLRFDANPTPLGILAVERDDGLLEDMRRLTVTLRERIIEVAAEEGLRDRINVEEQLSALDISTKRLQQAADQLSYAGLDVRLRYNPDNGEPLFQIDPDSDQFDDFYGFSGDLEGRLVDKYFRIGKEKEKSGQDDQLGSSRHTINPIFQSRINQVVERHGFVLMSFGKSWSQWLFEDVIRETLEAHDFVVRRADDMDGRIVMEDVWREINRSEFIIADMTGLNPNVMYELGIVDTVGKPVVALFQGDLDDDLPFDLEAYRTLPYEDELGGADHIKEELPDIVEGAIRAYRERNQSDELPLNTRLTGAYIRGGTFGGGGWGSGIV